MQKPSISPGALEHLRSLEEFHKVAPKKSVFASCYRKLLAHRYNLQLRPSDSVLEIGCGNGELLNELRGARKVGIDLSPEQVARGKERYPELDLRVGTGESAALPEGPFDVIVLSDVLNQAGDVEVLLRHLHECCHPGTRLVINVYNTLWRPLLGAARRCGLSAQQPVSSWLSRGDVINLCALADWEVFKDFSAILLPLPLGPLASVVNRWLAPLLSWLCLSIFFIARRSALPRREPGVVSVVVPARNEAGSIASAIERVPRLGRETELIFIEGHSKDNTWEVISALPDTFANGRIVKLRQTGKG